MQWQFADNNGGRDSGFHDAGVETFKGNFDRYLARELIQNSLDARRDKTKPVRVTFDLLEVERGDLPDIEGLTSTFARCAEYWTHESKAKKFFEAAERLARSQKIVALKVSDFNTTGVCGSDTEKEKNWYNLIRCAGASSKGGGEGGSFGIGKNAPFAASRLRTVLYSTLNDDGEHVFQGVATLASHKKPNGLVAQATGFLGGESGLSVRDPKQIPPKFLRQELGTDIIVLGFTVFDTWKKDLLYSVLENFWPAVAFGDLIVKVGEVQIDCSTLGQLLKGFSLEEEFTAHFYYQAYCSPTQDFHEELRHLKDVDLYLLTGEGELPKRVVMIRQTGMVVFPKRFQSVLPFCGVFICKNSEGNTILRDMEPPRHDVWDPNYPEKGAHRDIEVEYVRFIREKIKELAPADDSKVLTVPGLSHYLPDDQETPEEGFEGVAEEAKQEGYERRQPERTILAKTIPTRKTPLENEPTTPDGEDAESPGGGGGGGGGTDGKGKKKSAVQATPLPIRYRAYSINQAAGVYAASVQAEQRDYDHAQLAIHAVGDQGAYRANVDYARLADGTPVQVRDRYLLGPLAIPFSKPLRLEIRLTEPVRVALELSAYEAKP